MPLAFGMAMFAMVFWLRRDLTSNGFVTDPRAIMDLKADRERLKTALRACIEAMGNMHPGQDEYWRIVDEAEAVLKDSAE